MQLMQRFLYDSSCHSVAVFKSNDQSFLITLENFVRIRRRLKLNKIFVLRNLVQRHRFSDVVLQVFPFPPYKNV